MTASASVAAWIVAHAGGPEMAAQRTAAHVPVDDHAAPRAAAPASPTPWRGALAVGAVAAALVRADAVVGSRTHPRLAELRRQHRDRRFALYHPHHLAYSALARAWLNLLGAVGLGGDPLPRVEALNALFGGVAIGLVWALLRHRARVAPGVALAATAGAATSFGVWFYSVSVEVYVPPLTLLLATLLILTTPRPTLPAMAAVGVLNGLAVLAHQSNVLFAAVSSWSPCTGSTGDCADPARRLRRHRHGCGGRRLRGGAVPRRSAGLARRGHGLVHPLRPGVRLLAHHAAHPAGARRVQPIPRRRSLRLPLRRCPRPGHVGLPRQVAR